MSKLDWLIRDGAYILGGLLAVTLIGAVIVISLALEVV